MSVNDNYPDYTWSGDPNAPWNQAEPWETEHCCTCYYFHCIPSSICDTTVGFCADFDDYIDGDDSACFMWRYI